MFIELSSFEGLEKVIDHAAHEIAEMYDIWADKTMENVDDEEIAAEGFEDFGEMARLAMEEVQSHAVEVFSKALYGKLLHVEEEEEAESRGEVEEEEEEHEEDIHLEDESSEEYEEEYEEEEEE